MFIYIDLMTKGSTALNIRVCSLNSAVRYCSFKYGKHQLRVYVSDITLKDENITIINKKAENLFAPSEEFVLVSRM
jgi:hypothetical protein